MHMFEYAKSGRSSCRGPKKSCPVTDRSIKQGELRLGVEVETPRSLVFWRHWCCTTPKVIENLQEAYSEPSEIPGWETLRDNDQERIQRAWELGRIPEDELPQPAAEHTDPRAKSKGNADLPPTNEIAADGELKKGKKSKKVADEEPKDKKIEATKKNTKKGEKQSEIKKEEKDEVKKEEGANGKEKRAKKEQDQMIVKKAKKAPEEPKIASYASRKTAPSKGSNEPIRRSARVAAIKKEEQSN